MYGIIVSLGYHATHVLPIVRSKFDPRHAKRINIGTSHMITFLQRLLQLKYPAHASMITPSRAEVKLFNTLLLLLLFLNQTNFSLENCPSLLLLSLKCHIDKYYCL